ncbi:MAG: ComF family protein [Candidatus Zambryskibacteria bacterium]|nr:ComF family protein [Candidatus Zambryskibacteria bacterium]
MLKTVKNLFELLIDTILPPRTNFAIVKKLDEKAFSAIPEGARVEGMTWIHPLFAYKDKRVQAVIWELKYKENTLPLEYLGRLLYEEIIALISDVALFDGEAKFLLVPIPISGERRTERGYNQSELIAKAILENDTEHVLLYTPQWFAKIKDTPAQSHSQSKQERMKNLFGAFEADLRVENKYVILIDDVVTTGSTLSEARATLLSAGARDVFGFTIAH